MILLGRRHHQKDLQDLDFSNSMNDQKPAKIATPKNIIHRKPTTNTISGVYTTAASWVHVLYAATIAR